MKNRFFIVFILLIICHQQLGMFAFASSKLKDITFLESDYMNEERLLTSSFDRIENIVGNMSLFDKITQMMMMSIRYWDEDLKDNKGHVQFTEMNDQVSSMIEKYNFGAVIYFAQNMVNTEQVFNLTMDIQEAAVNYGGIPMLICTDQEGGLVYRLSTGTALPGNMALGATGNVKYSKMAGEIVGSELSVLGINTNLAPVVDVNNNANNSVIGLRSYGDDTVMVGKYAVEFIDGMSEYDVIGCAKHFPGHGDTNEDSHYNLPCVDKSKEDLLKCELIPYEFVISEGIEMIMTAHILYPQLESDEIFSYKTGKKEALPATMSDDIVTGLLKESMNFKGIVVTDAMDMAGITNNWDPLQAVINSIKAGVDMICMPCPLNDLNDVAFLDDIIDGIIKAVNDKTISMSRIDDAVTRILTVKMNRGILDWNYCNYDLENACDIVGGEYNREIERRISAAAVTVVQNKNNTLPLQITSQSKVLMLVPYDNEKAQMIIGWNRAKDAGLIPYGAEVRVFQFSKNKTLKTYLKEIEWADTIIFNSEISSARSMNGGGWESAYILEVLKYAESTGKTTVVQSVDKPYDVQSYPNADAVVAVYGCKGSSIDPTEALIKEIKGTDDVSITYGPNIIAGIEVILGVFGAKGTLPVDIPQFINGNYVENVIFKRGYGLRYDGLIQKQIDYID